MSVDCFRETRRGGLVRHASKSCRFSHHPLRVPKGWHRDFAACGQRSGLLALNLANIFEKLLDQKTFVCLRLVFGKPFAYGSARLGHIPSLPWESQLPLKPYLSLQPSDSERQLRFFRFSLRFLFHFIVRFCYLLRKRGLLAHTSAAFLKNCCTEKLFICLRLVSCNPYPQKSPPPIMPTFFVKYLTNIPESSIIRESVFSLDLEKHGCLHNL